MKKLLLLSFSLLTFTAAFALIGDANGDGIVNAADVSAIYRYLTMGDEQYVDNSDVNGDGYINTGDVSAVYDIIINGAPPEVTEYTVNGVTFKMVEVAGGTFGMGASADDTDAMAQERPVHQVTVSSFAIGQTVVTQELWQAVMGSNPSIFEGEQLPVHSISWADCQTFINALNSQLQIDGYKFRMPTEAEWEYAARGGKKSKGYKYSGSDSFDDVAWCQENSDRSLHNVGTKAPNELGIYDMSGNISEWCLDWKGDYSDEAQVDPTGPETGTYRIARGGAYSNPSSSSRVTSRPGYNPNGAASNLGLRLVLVPVNEISYTVNGATFTMVKVEGGTFTMGSTNNSDEQPIHQVTLSPFAIGQTEVTQELWQAVMGDNPSYFNGGSYGTDLQRPVEKVSWNDCQEFITKLNKLTGKNFRLPTEAEWEYAARGGAESKGYTYSGGNTLGDVAWYSDNSDFVSHDVGIKQGNELGIYDMSGNVWEWCQDWYGEYSAEAQTDPTGPYAGTERILRSGSFEHESWAFPPTFRNAMTPGYKDKTVGLRLVEGPSPKITVSANKAVFSMIKVEGGTFTMGASDDDTEAYDQEKPAHQVTLSSFWIGETEVTEGLWKAVMDGTLPNESLSMGDDYPVRFVRWDAAQEFITKLNEITGMEFVLPTDAQWEFAARGGILSKGYKYSGSNILDDVAWYSGNSEGVVHPVAAKAPNELGIFDMTGNVYEWCGDDIYNYTTDAQVDPFFPGTTMNKMLRSSCWLDDPMDCRVSARWLTNGVGIYYGMRLALKR